MSQHLTRMIVRRSCRVCGSVALRYIYSLGDFAVSGFFQSMRQATTARRIPLDLIECQDCGLVQLRHTAPPDLLYSEHYWYRSGLNPVITADLADIAAKAVTMVEWADKDVWLDIGANDGTLLSFVGPTIRRVACEPAKNLQPLTLENCEKLLPGFWSAESYFVSEKRKAKVVTAIGMFYDMEDPNQFVGDVKKVLAPDGVFVAQLMTLRQMIEKNDVGNALTHEHLEFYNYCSLVCLFERNGLEIFKVEENDINGGSYRLFARHLDKGSVAHEEPPVDWDAWIDRIEKNRKETHDFLCSAKNAGKRIWCYGASTKGCGILQWYGLDASIIDGVADRSPEKYGKYMAGSGVVVTSEVHARSQADIFFVLPYAFKDFFIEREREWRERGGKMVFSTPEFYLV